MPGEIILAVGAAICAWHLVEWLRDRRRLIPRIEALFLEAGLERLELVHLGRAAELVGQWGGAPVQVWLSHTRSLTAPVTVEIVLPGALPGLSARLLRLGERPTTRDPSPPVAALAAALLGDGEAWDLTPAWAQDQVVGVASAQLVALHQARADEGALLKLSRGEEGVALLALGALGAIGVRDTVPHLSQLAAAAPLGGRRAAAAREAITQIQARIGEAGRGQVAVVEAPAEAGRVEVIGEGGEIELADGGAVSLGDFN